MAGILHLVVATEPEHSQNKSLAIFFITGGMAQIFWTLPTAKRWGASWYYVGVAGNLALIILWVMTRMPNPITENGEAEPITEIGIVVELLQAAYIGLILAAIVKTRYTTKIDRRTATDAT